MKEEVKQLNLAVEGKMKNSTRNFNSEEIYFTKIKFNGKKGGKKFEAPTIGNKCDYDEESTCIERLD